MIKITSCLPRGGGFSPGTPASSTTKTGLHDIADILLKVKHQNSNSIMESTTVYLDTETVGRGGDNI